jgi:DNA-binding CsgD family transcriptional regulator
MRPPGADATLATVPDDGWAALFASAFNQSRNAMLLVDGDRRVIDANAALVQLLDRPRTSLVGHRLYDLVVGGPLATPLEWRRALREGRFSGEATLRRSDGGTVAVQWGAAAEVATSRRLVLFVVLSTSRWGARFRRTPDRARAPAALSPRERDVVRLVALGGAGPEIAEELGITHDTVRTHVRNAMVKVGARSRAHLVAKALGEARIDP